MTFDLATFTAFVHGIPTTDTIKYLNEYMKKKGVKVIYEKASDYTDDNQTYDRIIFSAYKRRCDYNFCGSIIRFDKELQHYMIISTPPLPPKIRYKNNKLMKVIAKEGARVIPAQDGTTLTLYWHKDRWVLSTYRGYDVNKYYWCNDITYEDALLQVLSAYPSFSYDKLNKSKCYTIGFRHSSFHPFIESSAVDSIGRAWFIRSIDMHHFNESKLSIDYNEDIGLPLQECVDMSTMRSPSHLISLATRALGSYRKDKQINYGYIVQHNNASYLIESSLMKNIRNIFYSDRFKNIDKTINRQKYAAVYAYLDKHTHSIFLELFPQYATLFAELTDVVSNLIESIVKVIAFRKTASDGETFKAQNMVEKVALQYLDFILQTISIDKLGVETSIDILYNYILESRNTKMLYGLVTIEQPDAEQSTTALE
jgi:hypothetical protein